MKYRENIICSKAEAIEHLTAAVASLAEGALTIDTAAVEIPEDIQLEYRIQYEVDETEGKFSVKISW